MDIIPTKKKNIIMDSQIMSMLMACPRKCDFRFNHNLVQIHGKSRSLEKGSLVHSFMEGFYLGLKEGKNRNDSIGQGFKYFEQKQLDVRNTPPDEIMEARDACEQYVKFRRNDAWSILEVEHGKGEVIYEDDELRILYKVKYDLIVDTNQAIEPVDHKTMSRRSETLDLNNQFMGQCRLLKSSRMLVNKVGFQISLKPEEKFERVVMSYSKDRMEEWIGLVGYYGHVLLSYSESGYWPPNFTHCDKFFGCEFKKVCQGDRNDRNRILKEGFVVGDPWDVEID